MGIKYPPLNPDIPRMGYILAYENAGDTFGNLIEKRQLRAGFPVYAAQITHVEISGGGYNSVNISPPLSKHIDITKSHKGRYVYLMKYKNDDYEKRGRYKVAYFSATLCNLGYDFFGIARFVLNWVKQRNRLYFCSEGCCVSMQKVYPEFLDSIKPENCFPAHFMDESLEKVWEGVI